MPGAPALALVMVAVTLWAYDRRPRGGRRALADKVFWSKVEYLGGNATVLLWLLFVLQYTGHERWLNRRRVGAPVHLPIFNVLAAPPTTGTAPLDRLHPRAGRHESDHLPPRTALCRGRPDHLRPHPGRHRSPGSHRGGAERPLPPPGLDLAGRLRGALDRRPALQPGSEPPSRPGSGAQSASWSAAASCSGVCCEARSLILFPWPATRSSSA